MVLATNSIGAIWSSSPPEFGVSAILERFTQLKPKVLLSADKYRVGGKDIDILPKLKQVVEALIPGGLKTVIVVGQLEKDRRPKAKLPEYKGVKSISYPDFLDKNPTKLTFWRGPAHAPIWVLYSSGTTGKPKAIVHNQAGMTFEMKVSASRSFTCRIGTYCFLRHAETRTLTQRLQGRRCADTGHNNWLDDVESDGQPPLSRHADYRIRRQSVRASSELPVGSGRQVQVSLTPT